MNAAIKEIVDECDPVLLHGYTSAQGDYGTRKVLADYTNARFATALNAECFYLTCGAAASLTIILNALLNAGDEVITFAPFFPEYRIFIENVHNIRHFYAFVVDELPVRFVRNQIDGVTVFFRILFKQFRKPYNLLFGVYDAAR